MAREKKTSQGTVRKFYCHFEEKSGKIELIVNITEGSKKRLGLLRG